MLTLQRQRRVWRARSLSPDNCLQEWSGPLWPRRSQGPLGRVGKRIAIGFGLIGDGIVMVDFVNGLLADLAGEGPHIGSAQGRLARRFEAGARAFSASLNRSLATFASLVLSEQATLRRLTTDRCPPIAGEPVRCPCRSGKGQCSLRMRKIKTRLGSDGPWHLKNHSTRPQD